MMQKATEVVAALIWDQDKFMICQRPAHKARGLLWEFVGGKVEPGETKSRRSSASVRRNWPSRWMWAKYLWMSSINIRI